MCGEKNETISQIVSEPSKLDQIEYKRRHDNVLERSIGYCVRNTILKSLKNGT